MAQKKKLWTFTAVILILLLSTTSGWNLYRVHQLKTQKQTISYQAEAMYQRNFGELTDSVEAMHDQLAQLLVTASQERLLSGLANLWREVYSAISSLGALPIAMHQLEQTDLLLHDIAEYSYYLMRKNVLQQNPLSTEDWSQLEEFYHRFHIVYQELESLESTVLSENFQLSALMLEDEENPVQTTFQSIEHQVTALPERTIIEGVRKIEPELHAINGKQISESQAINNANQFLTTLQQRLYQHNDATALKGEIAFRLDHTNLPVYGIAYPDNQYIEVSQVGGQILQYYCSQNLSPAVYTLEQVEEKAASILQMLVDATMICVEREADDAIANFVFVPEQDGVYLYSDMIKLQLSLYDGTLLSFDQTAYQTMHHQRVFAAPLLSKEAVLNNRNPNFRLSSVHLALIPDVYYDREVLTYELRGNLIGETFSIFVDAQTGQELRIVRL